MQQLRLYQRRFPDDQDVNFERARVEGYMQHSIEPLRQALRDHGDGLQEPGARAVVEAEIARAEGRYLDAVQLWTSVPNYSPFDREERIAFLYRAGGRTEDAARKFRDLERMASERLRHDPHDQAALQMLAVAQSMLGKHDAALAPIEVARIMYPESRDALNGPQISFTRSVIMLRAGRAAEAYAEVTRLLHVPFSSMLEVSEDPDPILLVLKDDPHYDELINRPPRL